jgi:hypothetical protein
VVGDGLRRGAGESAEFPTSVKEALAMCAPRGFAEAFALLLTRCGIAHKTERLYQNSLTMLSYETLILERLFGTNGSLDQTIQDYLVSDVPITEVFET